MAANHIENIKGLIIDMDGVLWRDMEPIGDLPVLFEKMRRKGLKVILATNNATRTVEEYLQKLAGFGVHLDYDQVITSSQAAGIYLKQRYPDGARAFVIGQPSLVRTLESYGVKIVDSDREDIQVVVASLDYDLSYEKLKLGSLLIQAGCEFIGTNPDATYPTPDGLMPGAGTVIGAIEIASGKKAKMMGKPHPILYEIALDRISLKPEETLAVGDRLETDILGAQAAGIHTALVLTGVSTLAQAHAFNPPPEIIVEDLTELVG